MFDWISGLRLPAGLAARILAHAQACYPEEACGLVAGVEGRAATLYPGRNISPTPGVAYELDHETLARMIDFEDAELELVAIYHSHPRGPEIPSHTDLTHASYPECVHLIVCLAMPDQPTLRGFQIREGTAREVEVRVDPTGC